jgi:hypothetical protein
VIYSDLIVPSVKQEAFSAIQRSNFDCISVTFSSRAIIEALHLFNPSKVLVKSIEHSDSANSRRATSILALSRFSVQVSETPAQYSRDWVF